MAFMQEVRENICKVKCRCCGTSTFFGSVVSQLFRYIEIDNFVVDLCSLTIFFEFVILELLKSSEKT